MGVSLLALTIISGRTLNVKVSFKSLGYCHRVYDPVCCKLLQTNAGHMDSIRCIIHISERNQYVSASWDRTIRIWNAYVKRSTTEGKEN